MKIGELSRRSGVSARSLRYYDQRGLLAVQRESNGYREYDDSTVSRAETIHLLFGLGFSREVVQSVLACTGDAPDSSHEALAEQLKDVESELAERIERFTNTHRKIVAFLEQWGH
ncbi:MerR family transcriptional regulator [Subtercola sp. Z020]|uniref:MerR family transcriptional regulator n=1 Tax=Subtercola sp. Z020 TaxID=2080582 RepID=UPI000CE8ADBC|nr:MerR family transcriptional regulator [Subtercola sp. Z020]PPF85662.1 MerR family transcriptional regulator [Subtercola sp. Z020]